MKLLIFDDNPMLAHANGRSLSAHFQVTVTTRLEAALYHLGNVDAVLSDWHAPEEVDGRTMWRACLAANKPVVVYSALPPIISTPTLTKPANLETIVHAINKAIGSQST